MKLIIGILAMLLPAGSFGQPDLRPLHIGDAVPRVGLTPLLNYPLKESSLAAFNDKLLILDFMTTGCAACIRALPHLDSLQKAFNGDIQVLLVTPEKEARVQAFLQRKYMKGLLLPVIAGDTMLARLFPFSFTPHEVIINKGRVAAITYPEYIVANNIRIILQGGKAPVPVKQDVAAFEYEKPLFVVNTAVIPAFSLPVHQSYSLVTSYMNNVDGRFIISRDTAQQIIRVAIINLPVTDMYIRTLYGDELRPAFIQLNVADTGRYVYKKANGYLHDWRQQNTYCYEASLPLHTPWEAVQKKIAADLDFYLGLQGRMVKRQRPCLVITKDSAAAGRSPEVFKEHEQPLPLAVSSIIFYLNGDFGNTPALDESGEGDLIIHGLKKEDYMNVAALQQKLKEYGLHIALANRVVNMLVLTEKKPN